MSRRILANKVHDYDPVWHVQIAVLVALCLQLLLPDRFASDFKYAIAVLEAILLLLLSATTPREPVFQSLTRRINALILIAVISVTNIYSLIRVANVLLSSNVTDGRGLILAAINIFITNIIIFGLWYWELDGGGPGQRRKLAHAERDFLFPQMALPDPSWHPTFLDYLYVSATNATAFSPTDTMPLSRRAKMLMLIQAMVSLIAIALVAARAVNILR